MKKFIVKEVDKKGDSRDIEINPLTLLQPVDNNVGNETPENIIQLDIKLMQPILKVGDTGISSKNLLHWKTNGLLLDYKHNIGGWTRFNFLQYVWLQVIKELREFGLSLDIIKKVKDGLIFPEDLYKPAVKQYAVSALKKDKKNIRTPLNEMKNFSEYAIFHESTSHYNNVLTDCIIRRINIYLVVFKNGDAYFLEEGNDLLFKRYNYNGDEQYDMRFVINKEEVRFRSHVCISLTEFIRLFAMHDTQSLTVNAIPILTEDEKQVIEHLKKNDLTELTVRVNDKKISLIEYTQTYNAVDLASRFKDHVLTDGYQDVRFKTKNGKSVHFSKTTSVKI